MRCFVAVVERGSVTGAAEALRVAPSAVSRRIKDLEGRLGTQLLVRTTRRMSLTEAGRSFHARCERILADVEEAEAEAATGRAALRGSLRIAGPLSFGMPYLTPIVLDFMKEHPEVVIDLDLSDRTIDLVAEGFDLAVRIGTLRDSSLVARKIADVRIIACAAPSLIEKMGMPETPEDLRTWPALCYTGSERPDIWRYRTPDGKEASVTMSVRMLANSGPLLCRAAIAGHGVVHEPSFYVHEAIAAGDLVPILRHVDWPGVAIHTVYPQTRHLTARARAFIDFVRARIGPKPYWEAFCDGEGGRSR